MMIFMTTAVTTSSRANALGVAFIGSGFMTEVHSRAARVAGAQLVGIASSTLESATRAGERFGVATAYASVDDLLADDRIDVVHVCTPNYLHTPFASAALRAGKHVVCEKPLATTVTDASQLVELARESGRTAAVPFVYRFHPMVREARARVQGGSIGRVLSVQGSYTQDWLLARTDDNWRVDSKLGGDSRAFADIGSHLCDLIEFVLGERISRLNAITSSIFGERGSSTHVTTEDVASVIFETESGVQGTIFVSQVASGRKNRLSLEVSGSDESVVFNQEMPEQLWLGRRAGSQLLVRDPETLSPEAARYSILPAGHAQGYQDAFNAFVADTYQSARGDTEMITGLPLFEDGLRAVQVTQAVLDSSRTGQWCQPGAQPTIPEEHNEAEQKAGLSWQL